MLPLILPSLARLLTRRDDVPPTTVRRISSGRH
jgi:hypothetical protein